MAAPIALSRLGARSAHARRRRVHIYSYDESHEPTPERVKPHHHIVHIHVEALAGTKCKSIGSIQPFVVLNNMQTALNKAAALPTDSCGPTFTEYSSRAFLGK